jgi:hypothetical protein
MLPHNPIPDSYWVRPGQLLAGEIEQARLEAGLSEEIEDG